MNYGWTAAEPIGATAVAAKAPSPLTLCRRTPRRSRAVVESRVKR